MNISKKKSIFLLLCFAVGLACSTESKATNIFSYTQDLYKAVHADDVSTVEELLTRKQYIVPRLFFFVDINHLLFEAAKHNQIKVATLLLKMGANVNALVWDDRHMHPWDVHPSRSLLIAIKNGHTKMVEFLIKHGAAVETGYRPTTSFATNHNRSALHLAAENGFDEIVKILLDNGASVDGQIYQTLFITTTPLSLAVEHGHTKTVEVLLKNGANPNASIDFTSLDFPWLGKPPMLYVYNMPPSQNKTDFIICSEKGEVPLHMAILGEHVEIAKFLIKYGANVQESALLANKSKMEKKRILKKDLTNLSPLELARTIKNQEIIDLVERATQIDQSFNERKQQALQKILVN